MQIVAERAVASSRLPRAATLEPISAEDLPLQGTVPPHCRLLPLPACEPEPSGLSGSFPGAPGDTAGDTGVAPPLPS